MRLAGRFVVSKVSRTCVECGAKTQVSGKPSAEILGWTCLYGHDEMDMCCTPRWTDKHVQVLEGRAAHRKALRSGEVRPLHEHVSHTRGRVECP